MVSHPFCDERKKDGAGGRQLFCEQLAVRSHPHQAQSRRVWKLIDQQQIWLQVTFAMVFPVAAESVAAVLLGERLVIGEQAGDLRQQSCDVLVPRCRFDAFVIALEG